MKPTIVAPQRRPATCSSTDTPSKSFPSQQAVQDPMRRFLRCPHSSHLVIAGRTVRLETNNPRLLDHMVELFPCPSTIAKDSPVFLWRIVVESASSYTPPWPRRSTFSEEGSRFAQFGQRNFLAVDLDVREAIGFVSEGLFEDVHGFTSPFIDTLFYMTAAGLGLVPFSAACLRVGTDALLVLGAPNQGKTTASYLAARSGGLTFHADQSVFLEIVNDDLRAWGDFVPLAFRPKTLEHLPELRQRTHRFSYCDFTFFYLPRERSGADRLAPPTPACCIVLERESSTIPRLDSLAGADVSRCLAEYIPFKDERRFEQQQQQVVAALAQLPVYRLAYDSNPANAAPFFRLLLSRHGKSSGSKTESGQGTG